MEKILISTCLIGDNCKYNGGNNQQDWIEHLNQYYQLVPFCPEVEGGLSIPREPSEIKHNLVINKKGRDVTKQFRSGAEKALNICRHAGITMAILKENSPSCGVYSVYDGSFKNKLVKGSGITATTLRNAGIKVISENEVQSLLEELDYQKQQQIEGRLKKIEEQKAKGSFVETPTEEDNNKPKFDKKKSFKKGGFKSFKGKKFEKKTKEDFVEDELSIKLVDAINDQPSEKKEYKGFKKDRKPFSRNRKPFGKKSEGGFRKDKKPFEKKDGDGFKKGRKSFRKDGEKSFSKDKKSFGRSRGFSKGKGFSKDRKFSGHSSFKKKSYSKKEN